ncbi:MAG: GLPGLI family protein [Chitinophagaceae bacterium]|nr:GLPGLI family protein [Chitinophagaceae bacterium]
MKKIFLLVGLSFWVAVSSAQSPILKEVKIEYEKKVNTWASIPAEMLDRFKQNMPQYSSSFYSYETDGKKSLYKAIPQENNAGMGGRGGGFFRMGQGSEDDEVFTDFVKGEQISLKSVFEKNYLLTDPIGHINWKLTNDYREIAGFNCRRATAIIMDSVFVVAFYTNEILAQGGPEGFTGLPGTILGLVINRLHTTWYATKVSVVDVKPDRIVAPIDSKAEKSSKLQLIESLKDRFQNNRSGRGFGNNDDSMIWRIMI